MNFLGDPGGSERRSECVSNIMRNVHKQNMGECNFNFRLLLIPLPIDIEISYIIARYAFPPARDRHCHHWQRALALALRYIRSAPPVSSRPHIKFPCRKQQTGWKTKRRNMISVCTATVAGNVTSSSRLRVVRDTTSQERAEA